MKSLAIANALLLLSAAAFAQSGRGMGLALPAELNGYPGPIHVLELSDQLGLSADQKTRVQALFDSMKAEAVPLGLKLLEQEGALDQLFSNPSVTAESLKAATAEIVATQAALRDIHLKYHLQTAQILSAEQMQHYSVLRGYGSGDATSSHAVNERPPLPVAVVCRVAAQPLRRARREQAAIGLRVLRERTGSEIGGEVAFQG